MVDPVGVTVPLVAFVFPRLSHRPSLELAVGFIDTWADALAGMGLEVACARVASDLGAPRLGSEPEGFERHPTDAPARDDPDLLALVEVCPRRGGFRGTLSIRDASTRVQHRWVSFRGGAWSVVDFAESGLIALADTAGVYCEPAFRPWLGVTTPREAVEQLRRIGARGLTRRRATQLPSRPRHHRRSAPVRLSSALDVAAGTDGRR